MYLEKELRRKLANMPTGSNHDKQAKKEREDLIMKIIRLESTPETYATNHIIKTMR